MWPTATHTSIKAMLLCVKTPRSKSNNSRGHQWAKKASSLESSCLMKVETCTTHFFLATEIGLKSLWPHQVAQRNMQCTIWKKNVEEEWQAYWWQMHSLDMDDKRYTQRLMIWKPCTCSQVTAWLAKSNSGQYWCWFKPRTWKGWVNSASQQGSGRASWKQMQCWQNLCWWHSLMSMEERKWEMGQI